MRFVNNLDIDSWNSFVLNHPHGNIFHTPEMFQVFNQTQGYFPSLWAVENSNGKILALMLPVQVKLNDILSVLTTRAIVYGGVLFEEGQNGWDALDFLLQTYKYETDNPPLFTELRNLSDFAPVHSIFLRNGFLYEDHLNYLIDIAQPVEEIFQRIGRRTRKNIRRGLNRKKVHVHEIMEVGQLNLSIRLIQKTYANAKIPLAHHSLFENAFNLLHPKSMVRFTIASKGAELAATSVELLFKDVIYGWYSGLDREYSAYVPNELLMWDILKWGAESGYRIYDFGGAGKPDKEYGVRDFKAKFGGDLVCFGRNTYVHRPELLRLSKVGYRVYQSLKDVRTPRLTKKR